MLALFLYIQCCECLLSVCRCVLQSRYIHNSGKSIIQSPTICKTCDKKPFHIKLLSFSSHGQIPFRSCWWQEVYPVFGYFFRSRVSTTFRFSLLFSRSKKATWKKTGECWQKASSDFLCFPGFLSFMSDIICFAEPCEKSAHFFPYFFPFLSLLISS